MSRVYLETSYVSACVTDRTDTDSLYRLKHSREWWDKQRQLHDLFVSPEVVAELSVESYRCKDQALAWISGVLLLEIDDDVLGLARVLMNEKAMPAGSGDAVHVAVAAVHGIQYMVSWNVKHLANVNKRERLCPVWLHRTRDPDAGCFLGDLIMKSASDVSASEPLRSHEFPPGPPAPTGDPFIDEVRAIKYELSARFDHDVEKLGAHLKAIQENIARREPHRTVRRPERQQ